MEIYKPEKFSNNILSYYKQISNKIIYFLNLNEKFVKSLNYLASKKPLNDNPLMAFNCIIVKNVYVMIFIY